MKKEYIYLIAEELYKTASIHELCNRSWLFCIYRSLLTSIENDQKEMVWTKYKEWQIDHNCRASKAKATKNETYIHSITVERLDQDRCIIGVQFNTKKGTLAFEVPYNRIGFPISLWETQSPKGETALMSSYERDQLFESSCRNATPVENDSVHETILEQVEIAEPIEAVNEVITEVIQPKRRKVTNRRTDEEARESKFRALWNILNAVRPVYQQTENEQERSYMETVVGAAVFYLPNLNEHFSGYISLNALIGYVSGNRRVKDHMYPRKLAARDLLAQELTAEELKERYHLHLAQFMYVTATENSMLVNYYEEHEGHDQALAAFQIHKFPGDGHEKFKDHRELEDFISLLRPSELRGIDLFGLHELLRTFRDQ